MARSLHVKLSIDGLWFGFLVIYIISGYLANNLLLPEAVNQLALYAFLGFSMFMLLLRGKVKLDTFLLWELLCLGLAFLAMLYSPEFSLFGGAYYSMIVNSILVFIFVQMPWNEKRFAMAMKTYVFSAVMLIAALAATGNLEDPSESGRLGTEVVGNANQLATMLMVAAVYGVWWFVSSRRVLVKFLVALFLSVIYIGMFLSGGRKFIIAPIIFAYILLLNKKDKKGRTHIIKNTVVIIAVVVLIYQVIMNVPFFYESIGVRFESFFGLFGGSHRVDGSTLLRKRMTEAAFERWLDSPIWGFGFDSFKYYNLEEVAGHFFYSHNNFTEMLHNQGLIGFWGYYGFYVWLLCAALKQRDTLRKGFVLGIVIMLLPFEYLCVTYNVTPIQIMLFFCCYQLQTKHSRQRKLGDYE